MFNLIYGPSSDIVLSFQQMPGLQSFCVCTAVALASIYLLQLTWFTAWLVIDERRKEAGRDGLLPCLVHRDPDLQPAASSLAPASGHLGDRLWQFIEILNILKIFFLLKIPIYFDRWFKAKYSLLCSQALGCVRGNYGGLGLQEPRHPRVRSVDSSNSSTLVQTFPCCIVFIKWKFMWRRHWQSWFRWFSIISLGLVE